MWFRITNKTLWSLEKYLSKSSCTFNKLIPNFIIHASWLKLYVNLIKKEATAQLFSYKFCKSKRVSFSTKRLRWLLLVSHTFKFGCNVTRLRVLCRCVCISWEIICKSYNDFRLNDIFLDLININDKNKFYGMEV